MVLHNMAQRSSRVASIEPLEEYRKIAKSKHAQSLEEIHHTLKE